MRHLLVALTLLLACGDEPRPTRAAVDPTKAMLRIADLPDNPERRALISSLRRAPAEEVQPLLTAGFTSQLATHRVAAALVTGRRTDGELFIDDLLLAAADPEPSVRIAAARALGALRLSAGFPALQSNLSHETASVRTSALRALARIDPARAAALPELPRLQLDPDPGVADTATKVARQTAQ